MTSDTFILPAIVDAMTNLRRLDIPIEKITLTREHFHALSHKELFNYFSPANSGIPYPDPTRVGVRVTHPPYINNPDLMSPTRPERTIGELFGAPVIIADASKVYGPPGINPRYRLEEREGTDGLHLTLKLVSHRVLDNQDPFTSDIVIDGIKYKLRQLRNNLTIIVKSRADFYDTIPENEWKAIETLREMITELEFRKYLKYGFVLVKGQSGKVYQVYRSRSHTKIWFKGELIAEVCVRLKDMGIPPTDNVIAFKTMIEFSEEDFVKAGNYYNFKKAG